MESSRPSASPAGAGKADEVPQLVRNRRVRRRQASLCFLFAGIGFGTAIYFLRARFATLGPEFLLLVGIMVALFWLGARAESDVTQIDDRLREIAEARATRRGPIDSMK
jgi:hypothetical protein